MADIHDQDWRRFVEGRSERLAFHHPDWAILLADCYGFPAFALAVRDEAGTLIAGMPVLEVRSIRGGAVGYRCRLPTFARRLARRAPDTINWRASSASRR